MVSVAGVWPRTLGGKHDDFCWFTSVLAGMNLNEIGWKKTQKKVSAINVCIDIWLMP
jgi:hypothetical protein